MPPHKSSPIHYPALTWMYGACVTTALLLAGLIKRQPLADGWYVIGIVQKLLRECWQLSNYLMHFPHIARRRISLIISRLASATVRAIQLMILIYHVHYMRQGFCLTRLQTQSLLVQATTDPWDIVSMLEHAYAMVKTQAITNTFLSRRGYETPPILASILTEATRQELLQQHRIIRSHIALTFSIEMIHDRVWEHQDRPLAPLLAPFLAQGEPFAPIITPLLRHRLQQAAHTVTTEERQIADAFFTQLPIGQILQRQQNLAPPNAIMEQIKANPRPIKNVISKAARIRARELIEEVD